MIENNIVEETTPVFGDAPEAEAPQHVPQEANADVAQEEKVLSWEEEKTLLVFEEDEQSASARLINSDTGEAVELDSFPYRVGRGKTVDLQINHRSVSREHASINLQSGGAGFIIEDIGSSNGIRVNGIKTAKVMLGDNDRVRFGDVEFTFELEQSEARPANEINGTAVTLSESSDATPGAKRGFSLPKPDWAAMKKRMPLAALRGQEGGESGGLKSKYPLIAVAAAAVLATAYFLSPARRVTIVETPVAQSTPPVAEVAAATEPEVVVASSSVSDDSVPSDSEAASAEQEPAAPVAATSDQPEQTSVEDGAVAAAVAESSAPAEGEAAKSAPASTAVVTTETLIADSQKVNESLDSGASAAAQKVADGATPTDSDAPTATASSDIAAAQPVAEAPKQVIRRSPEWSRAYIRNSLAMYTEGDVDSAVKRLRILSRSRRHQPQFREEAGGLADGIDSMYQQYQSGRSLFDQGQHDDAFLIWRSFLVDESNLLPGQESVFASNIKNEVVNLYTQQGNAAYADGRQHDAYLSWQKASAISPGGEAAMALADLEQRAKQRFIDGYMQESVSLQTATSMWRDVIDMVPPANEYHVKAKAKLRLYKNYGS